MESSFILAFTGLAGSGKTYLVNKHFGGDEFAVFRLGQLLRDKLCNEMGSDVKDIHDKAEEARKVTKSGSIGELCEAKIHCAINSNAIIIVDSIRSIDDYRYFGSFGVPLYTVMVVADKIIRHTRIDNRKRQDDISKENLLAHDIWEMGFGIQDLFPYVDRFIVNNGDRAIQAEELLSYPEREIICLSR
jgi:dephospho-CoA kinase